MKEDYIELCNNVRKDIFSMISRSGTGHYASSFSCVEILIALYFGNVMKYKREENTECDRFIMSKGHAVAALYAVMVRAGLMPKEVLETYCKSGSELGGVASDNIMYGIEGSGSLGHGLGFAGGIALTAKLSKKKQRIFVLIGDGECQEGSVWEAIMCISSYKLDNVTVIVERNGLQASDFTENLIEMNNMYARWEAFGWDACVVDGHNVYTLIEALNRVHTEKKPKVVIANTIKGKGVSFLENSPDWHNRIMSDKELKQAKRELGIKNG